MVTSAYYRGWSPFTPNSYATPVQVEDATGGLCGAELPDGRGILVWPNGNNIRFAIVDSPLSFIVDDVVPAEDIQTAVAMADVVYHRTAVYMANGGLYITSVVRRYVGGVIYGFTTIYKANSPTNPSSWSLHCTLQTDSAQGAQFASSHGAGIPLILESGRWVLINPIFEGSLGTFPQFWAMYVGGWYSDDDGLTFTQTVAYKHIYFFVRVDQMSVQIARSPITGYLYFTSGSSAGGPEYTQALWRSTDSGTSWSIVNVPNGAFGDDYYTKPHITAFVDNGQMLFAMGGGSVYYLDPTTPGTEVLDWKYTGDAWAAPGASVQEVTQKAIVTTRGLYFFTYNQVMRVLGPIQLEPRRRGHALAGPEAQRKHTYGHL